MLNPEARLNPCRLAREIGVSRDTVMSFIDRGLPFEDYTPEGAKYKTLLIRWTDYLEFAASRKRRAGEKILTLSEN